MEIFSNYFFIFCLYFKSWPLNVALIIKSSVQNILLRYGIKHDLNFVLPQKKYENQFFDEKSGAKKLLFQPFKVI